MSASSINNLASSYLQSVLSSALQNAGVSSNKTSNSLNGAGALSSTQTSDKSGLSPFAQLMTTLQQLQQSDPAKYKQVTGQIAANLTTAASTAQSEGNTTAATQLTQLANDFTTASQTGQLPNVQDLAKAVGGHHHHHGHAHATVPDSDTSTSVAGTGASSGSSGTSANTTAVQMLTQLMQSLQSNGAQSDSLNPMSIILNTLSSAGLSGTNS